VQPVEEALVSTEDPWKRRLAALGDAIRSQRASSKMTLRDLAERAQVSNAYLSQIERGLHEPSIRVLHSIAAALDVPLELLLVQAGLLESRSPEHARGESRIADTEAAIMADARLTGPQRFALLSIYRSFVGPL
jgi:transcriptional regulator with XRE-family HTH domain